MNNKGFSFLEVMVVVSIIGIMSVIMIPSYNKSMNNKALLLGNKLIMSDIRMVQGYSYSVQEFGGVFPEGGYGIHFDSGLNSYIIFADLAPANKIYDGLAEKVKEVSLTKNVKVNSTTVNAIVIDPVDIIFQPPYGDIFINTVKDIDQIMKIEIINGEGSTSTITINSAGAID